jgi:hypothetical protein
VAYPFAQLIGPIEGQALFVDRNSPQKSSHQHPYCCKGQQIHGNKSLCAMTDIPVNFSSKFHHFLQLQLLASSLPTRDRGFHHRPPERFSFPFINNAYVKVKFFQPSFLIVRKPTGRSVIIYYFHLTKEWTA